MKDDASEITVYTSLGATMLLLVAFYVFAAPFHNWTEMRREWTPYVYGSLYLYWWLLTAIAFHFSGSLSGLVDYDIKQPISLFFPIFGVTVLFLCILELILVMARHILSLFNNTSLHRVSVVRSITAVIFNAGLVSVACCLVFTECDGELSQSKVDVMTSKQAACASIFDFTSKGIVLPGPSSWNVVLLVWCTGMILVTATFVIEWLASYSFFLEEHFPAQEEYDDDNTKKPASSDALPMVSWYSMVMFDVVFDLLISLKVFLGRYMLRDNGHNLTSGFTASLYKDSPPIFDHLANREELWLDFMADCGDGFNPSYQVARMLAQPKLTVKWQRPLVEPGEKGSTELGESTEYLSLPRGECLVIGGDLAYHHPTAFNYEKRFWRVFEYAMQPPRHYNPSEIALHKPDLPEFCKSLSDYEGPTAFCIPGNHDWYDGLGTFLRFVCHRNWLGGWLLPQRSSYFALKLPKGWWLFGCDLALEDDLDLPQYTFFAEIAEEKMGPTDRVIIVTHEPNWILDPYLGEKTGQNLSYLMDVVLANRVALRLAGDIHNYQRHSPVQNDRDLFSASSADIRPPRSHSFVDLSEYKKEIADWQGSQDKKPPSEGEEPVHIKKVRSISNEMAEHLERSVSEPKQPAREQRYHTPPPPVRHPALVVAGGGGAFLHPTHAPDMETVDVNGAAYRQVAAFPSKAISRRYALLNIFGFRKRHWRLDFVSAVTYFTLCFSLLPRCNVHVFHGNNNSHFLYRYANAALDMQMELLFDSWVSLGAMMLLFIHLVLFADYNVWWKKILSGFIHCICHCTAAICAAIMLESIIEVGISSGSLGKQGVDTVWKFLTSRIPEELSNDLAVYDVFGFGRLLVFGIKQLTIFYNVPEMHAKIRLEICEGGIEKVDRVDAIIYYFTWFLYYFIMAAPVCAMVFGTYLYVCVNFLGVHYNEAFSSLKIENYKHIVRLHINKEGQCELYALGIDKVPKKWIRDDQWSGSNRLRHLSGEVPSFKHQRPSRWQPRVSRLDAMLTMDFEDPSETMKVHTAKDRYGIKVVDYLKL